MEEIISTIGGGASALVLSIAYARWSIQQHGKEIDKLTSRLDINDEKDAIRNETLAVMQSSLSGMDTHLAAKIDGLKLEILNNYDSKLTRFDDRIKSVETYLDQNEPDRKRAMELLAIVQTKMESIEVGMNRMLSKFDEYDKSIQAFYRKNPEL